MALDETTGRSANAGEDYIQVDLRQREVAGFYAWLWPGAGHLYQRRYAKGFLFMICILSTFFFGLALGGGRVVYAQFDEDHYRWQYALQVGVGLPALPAVVQGYRAKRPELEPFFNGVMAPPKFTAWDQYDELGQIHEDLNMRFELGTLYTVIAGLLNVLAIYDACCGPMLPVKNEDEGGGADGSGTNPSADESG